MQQALFQTLAYSAWRLTGPGNLRTDKPTEESYKISFSADLAMTLHKNKSSGKKTDMFTVVLVLVLNGLLSLHFQTLRY